MRVIAQGRLRQRSYQDRDGNNRTAIELEVDEIGPSLRYATAQVARAASNRQGQAPASAAPAEQQWPTHEPGEQWGAFGDDTPF